MSSPRGVPVLLDSNVLAYAYDRRDPRHASARRLLARAVRGELAAAITEQVLLELVSLMTHPRAARPRPARQAAGLAGRLLRARHLEYVGPTRRSSKLALTLIARHSLRGAEVHDARLAGLVLARRLPGIYTFDRGFRRFEADGVRVLEP